MKLKLQHALVAVAALGTVQMASAATVVTAGVTPTLVPDGTITISGSVADSTCLVNGSNAYNNTTVPLTAALTTVLNAGNPGPSNTFNINLTNCPTGNISTLFIDNAVSSIDATHHLENQDPVGAGTATGVVAQILYGGNPVTLKTQTIPSGTGTTGQGLPIYLVTAPGTNTYNQEFTAQLLSPGNNATVGTYSSKIQYTIVYN